MHNQYQLKASIGSAPIPKDGVEPDELLEMLFHIAKLNFDVGQLYMLHERRGELLSFGRKNHD